MTRILILAGLSIATVGALAVEWRGQQQPSLRYAPAQPSPTIAMPAAAERTPYTRASFADGMRYPPPVTVDLLDGSAKPGATTAAVRVQLSAAAPNTVIAYIRCRAGAGAAPVADRTQAIIFRPGDPIDVPVACPVRSGDAGDTVEFIQAYAPDGAKQGNKTALARFIEAAATTPTDVTGFRTPYRFAPLGKLVYDADAVTLAFADKGAGNIWSTGLPHGRTQPGNGEVGYYGAMATGAISATPGGLVLRSARIAKPIDAAGSRYPFLASVLSGHASRDLQFTYGSIEWVARMPDRTGSWPALWLGAVGGWPPEIDAYEGFSFNREWKPASSLSSTIHGGRGGKRSFTRSLYRLRMGDLGLPATLTSDFHRFQLTVDPGWITVFIDGVETFRYANAFGGTRWYPLMTVGVKADPADPYDSGSGDMLIRSVRIWRSE